jgi:type I restriction enzyme S subunit
MFLKSWGMRSNYKKLGEYIELVTHRNSELLYGECDVRGVSNNKEVIQTKANNKDRAFNNFYVVAPNDFIYNSRTSRMGDKVGLGFNDTEKSFITSFNNTVFRVKNEALLPMYLFMWFNRPEFDRYARFHSWGSSTELFSWGDMCNVELPVSSIEKQREIVKEYNTIVNRIKLNEQLNQKLEETAQALYKHWFVDFEFPDADGKPYKSSGGKMLFNAELEKGIPEGWGVEYLNSFIEVKYGKDYKALSYGDIPLYGSGGIMSHVNAFLYDKPSILIPRKGTLTNIMYVDKPFWSVDTMFYSRILDKSFGFYVFHYLNRLDFNALNVGSAVPSMTTKILNDFRLIKPDLEVLESFNMKLDVLYQNSKSRNFQVEKLNELRNTILSKMTKVETSQTT